jgi:flagellar hook-basal body complex protein FliE
MVAPLIAAKAYAAAQGIGGADLAGAAGALGQAAGPNFGQMVSQAINQAVADSKTAETQITANVQGKANLVDVVTALSSAQTSLNAMVAVRNQMIQSYQQIMNMAI